MISKGTVAGETTGKSELIEQSITSTWRIWRDTVTLPVAPFGECLFLVTDES